MDDELVCSQCGQTDKAGVLIGDARKGTRKPYIGPDERLCIPCALERGFPADCALETVTRKIGTLRASLAASEARVAVMEPVVAAAIAFRDVNALVESDEWAEAAMALSDAIDVYQAALRGEEVQG